MKKIVLTMTVCLITLGVMMAQIKVNGTVTDASGKKVSGVLVTEKGTKNGTITDLQGKYELQVPSKNTVLEFLMIGVDRVEKKCSGKIPLNVQLSGAVGDNAQKPNETSIVLYDRFGKKIANKEGIILKKDKPDFSDFINEKEFEKLEANTYFYLMTKGKEQKTGYLKKEEGESFKKKEGGKIYNVTYKGAFIKRSLKENNVYLDVDGKKTLLKDGAVIDGVKVTLSRKKLKLKGLIDYKEKASIWFGDKEFHIDGKENTDICSKMQILRSNGELEEVLFEILRLSNFFVVDKKNNSKLNSVLYVIDGVPVSNENTIKEISPDSIKQMFVLKGETAAAVYGERGKNGVIIITTKKGQK